jgi:metallo-beta-lactamase family protein
MIIAGSGMCEAGRILHHLRNGLEDERNLVLIIGYQAPHTLGRKLVERQPAVRVFGVERALEAEVVVMDEFSAHADREDLADFVSRCRGRLKRVFLVHGEEGQATAMAARLEPLGPETLHVPMPGEFVRI